MIYKELLKQLKAISLAVPLLLCGCLTSEVPLIDSSDLPLTTGTQLKQYSDTTGAYTEPSNHGIKQLTIRDGWYVYSEPNQGDIIFKLHKINENAWVMMTNPGLENHKYAYGWLRREGDLYIIYPGDSKKFKNWNSSTGIGVYWQPRDKNIQILTLDYLVKTMPTAIAGNTYEKPMAFRLATAEDIEFEKKMEIAMEVTDNHLTELREKIKKHEARLKELCGRRVCIDLGNGNHLYRTEFYDPPKWYYNDGRLAPESVWPK